MICIRKYIIIFTLLRITINIFWNARSSDHLAYEIILKSENFFGDCTSLMLLSFSYHKFSFIQKCLLFQSILLTKRRFCSWKGTQTTRSWSCSSQPPIWDCREWIFYRTLTVFDLECIAWYSEMFLENKELHHGK